MKVINGDILKQMLVSASNNLYNHHHEIDALNVFPVPDGDTGMNMNLTLTSGVNDIKNNDKHLSSSEISKIFARGLLMGARGNSGVITSQIFKGFSLGLENLDEIDALDFANALKMGSDTAYKAVLKPVEGTILTVIRETSDGLAEIAYSGMPFEKLMPQLTKLAKQSLERTPELLPILKEVGVVDSGGAGLVSIFEGMAQVIYGHPVIRNDEQHNRKEVLSAAAKALGKDEFGYCTEFIMTLGPSSTKKPFDKAKFTDSISQKGTSLAVVNDEDLLKVHIHTMNPGEILSFAQQYGEFLKLKIENMTEQHHSLEAGAFKEAPVSPEVVASSEPTKEYAIIAVSSGEGIDSFFTELGVSIIVKGGQTMNPSSEDFVAAIRRANARNVFILPNNSNIVMAASQACEMFENEDINAFVIPSKTILQGVVAVINFNPEIKASINFRQMKSALKTIRSGEITFSIRDCDLNGIKIHKGDFIGIYEKNIVVSCKNKTDTLIDLLSKMVSPESALVTIIYGEDITDKEADTLRKKLSSDYPELNFDIRSGKQPVYSYLIGVE